MQSRRNEEYVVVNPSRNMRLHHGYEVGDDQYVDSRHGAADRSQHVQGRRSLSPYGKADGLRRISLNKGTSGFVDRRDYGWSSSSGRSETIYSVSPTYVQKYEKYDMDEGVAYRRREYAEDVHYDNHQKNGPRQVYRYAYRGQSPGMGQERDYGEDIITTNYRHGSMEQKSLPAEDGVMRGPHQVLRDLVPISTHGEISDRDFAPASNYRECSDRVLPTSTYRETSEKSPFPLRRVDIDGLEHDRCCCRECVAQDSVQVMELYKEEKKPIFHSRGYSRSSGHAFDSNRSSSQFKDYTGIPSGSRSEFVSSHGRPLPFAAAKEYREGTLNITEPVDFDTFGQVLNERGLDVGKRHKRLYPHGYNVANASEHRDSCFLKSRTMKNDNHIYISDAHNMMPPSSGVDYELAHKNHRPEEVSRQSEVHPTSYDVDDIHDSHLNVGNVTVWEHPTIKKQEKYVLNHSEEYMECGYIQDKKPSNLRMVQDEEAFKLRSNYGFGKDAGPHIEMDVSLYDIERQELGLRRWGTKEDVALYEPSNKGLKRRYIVEETDRYDKRVIVPGKSNLPRECEDEYDSAHERFINEDASGSHRSRIQRLDYRKDRRTVMVPRDSGLPEHFVDEYDIVHDGFIDEDGSGSYRSEIQRFDHNKYRKDKRTLSGEGNHRNFMSEDRSLYQNIVPQTQRHLVKQYRPSAKYIKGQHGSDSLAWHNSKHSERVSAIQTRKSFLKRNDNDRDEYMEEHAYDPSEDWIHQAQSQSPEDSEEFKQLVNECFFDYSKRLNLDSAVRRRYKEQGNAGSLYCIVCGKSTSKEFLDTQRLVQHAFMSHRVGLRAKHLGLLKAICVLMGWNTFVPSDIITWIPDKLPKAEALAQKEDLILWPPLIVIRNISMSNNCPEEQKVIPVEGVQAFLRGKGFIGGKVCLGKPADQSVILVKFLDTFPGFGNAERVHKYFAENKYGREEFEQKGSSKSSRQEDPEGDNLEEQLLYGYMGIAEDLDCLDSNTKKWVSVRSKKGIQDLDNAPVKADDR